MKLCLKGTRVTWYSSVDLNINALSRKSRYLAAFEHFSQEFTQSFKKEKKHVKTILSL